MNAAALSFTALSVLGFGLWGVLMKLGQQRLGVVPHLMGMGLTIVFLMLLALVSGRFSLPELKFDWWLPVGATMATVAAIFFMTLALSKAPDNASAVVALSALYPGVTALLSALLLKEPFSTAKLAGVACALLAAFLFTR